jgi:predicted ATP-dependent endonuclease of OLD family
MDAVTQGDREAKIYVESITFSAGQTISLNDSSILVIVGPNNAGKSSVLREIRDHLQDGLQFGPVLHSAEIRVKGSISAFKKEILEAGLATGKESVIRISYSEYELRKVDDEIKTGFIGSKIIPFFLSYLGAEERLKIQCNGLNSMREPKSG